MLRSGYTLSLLIAATSLINSAIGLRIQICNPQLAQISPFNPLTGGGVAYP